MKHGLLLINLGTPASADVSSICRYLGQFLTDKRVITLPALLRYLLVYFFILPVRSRKTTHAYQSIWTEEGSPLLIHSQNLANKVQQKLGAKNKIALGMRYGEPSIKTALNRLKHCDFITILPLYPHYSSAATGSCLVEAMRIISSWALIPSISIIRDFFHHPAYINAQAHRIKDHLQENTFVLFSYHGIPEAQLTKSICPSICSGPCPDLGENNRGCYKAQCHQSSHLLAKKLGLAPEIYTTAFQSRLGSTLWIKPYLDETLVALSAKGIKKLTIVCPSFVSDCLETLEEIKIRAYQQWKALGGETFMLIPCMNTASVWVDALVEITDLNPPISHVN